MIKPSIGEALCLIHSLVQSHDGRNVVALEIGEVVLWGMQGVAVLDPAAVVGASKSQKLPCRGGEGETRPKSELHSHPPCMEIC